MSHEDMSSIHVLLLSVLAVVHPLSDPQNPPPYTERNQRLQCDRQKSTWVAVQDTRQSCRTTKAVAEAEALTMMKRAAARTLISVVLETHACHWSCAQVRCRHAGRRRRIGARHRRSTRPNPPMNPMCTTIAG